MRRIPAAAAAGLAVLLLLPACKSMDSKVLKDSIEVVDFQSQWVSKLYQPWPPRLILVPEISFRIKNVGAEPLNYVNFNAVFNFKGDPENFGDAFLAAIRKKAVAPGELSPVITMKSNFGVEGKTVKGIAENPMWKTAECRLYARSKGSQYVQLGVYDISREIGFKEPEAPVIKKGEPEK